MNVPQMKMPSVMKGSHNFARIPSVSIPRSTFDRSHGYKTTFNSGYLIPVLVDEVLPGDTFNCSATFFARMTTPKLPIMDNLFLESFFFFVPDRLVWDHFQAFMGEQEPSTFTVYTEPVFTGYVPATGSLSDLMGVPLGFGHNVVHRSLPMRCYNLIYNQWFRDENLVPSAVVDKGDGPDTIANYVLRRRGKRPDYFTACLPWTQKSATQVTLPLGTTAPVIPAGAGYPVFVGATSAHAGELQAVGAAGITPVQINDLGAGNFAAGERLLWSSGGVSLQADLSNATAATINAIRQAVQIQKFLERDARGGTRYIEKNWAHFGVRSPDARLQRAEYLGGGSTPVNVAPIAQTAPSGGGASVVGYLGAAAAAVAHGHGFSKSFTEHGWVIGLINVRADLNYDQGLERMWSRSTLYDRFWPEYAHLGEQAVLNQELYYDSTLGGGLSNGAAFGYQERYAEYRYKPSRITGLFRNDAAGTLNTWHAEQKFVGLPTLGQTFIEENPPISARLAAVSTEPEFYLDSYFRYVCARAMPVFGVPGMMDHF